jgi:phosphoglycerate kinase
MAYKSIQDLDLKDKCVFIRVDFNVPLDETGKKIGSDTRIRAALPTINLALEKGAKVILASHLGRPKGKPNATMSLAPVAERLSELLGKPVAMAPDSVGDAVAAQVKKMKSGDVLLLKTCAFTPRKKRTTKDSPNNWLHCAMSM